MSTRWCSDCTDDAGEPGHRDAAGAAVRAGFSALLLRLLTVSQCAPGSAGLASWEGRVILRGALFESSIGFGVLVTGPAAVLRPRVARHFDE